MGKKDVNLIDFNMSLLHCVVQDAAFRYYVDAELGKSEKVSLIPLFSFSFLSLGVSWRKADA